jgi:hypothetical protein
MQQHLAQQEIRRPGLSIQAPSLPKNDSLKISTVMQQIITELGETVSEKDKIKVIAKIILNIMKQNGC